MKERYDTIVIGAGLGGLTAGALLSRKGEKVLMLEKHVIPGGYATNFKRKKFNFDVGLHSLNELKKGEPVYDLLMELGITDKVNFLPHHKNYSAIFPGINLSVKSNDLPAYEAQLIELFPEEEKGIRTILSETRALYDDVIHCLATLEVSERIKKYELYTVEEFWGDLIQSEKLKQVLYAQGMYYLLPPERLSFLVWSFFIHSFMNGTYSIEGGSQNLSDEMVEIIEENGRFITRAEVSEIIIENGKATGVISDKGEFYADKIISNITPYNTVEMANRENFPVEFLEMLDSREVALSGAQLYIGLDCTQQDLGIKDDEYTFFLWDDLPLTEEFKIFEDNAHTEEQGPMIVTFFSGVDKTMTRPGESTMAIFTPLGWDDWQGLSGVEYLEKKMALEKTLIKRAEKEFPGISKHIKVCETGTPHTLWRYTANTGGSMIGFALTPDQTFFRRFPLQYPIEGLYQAGHWTFPATGYSGAMLSGKALVDLHLNQLIKEKEAKPA